MNFDEAFEAFETVREALEDGVPDREALAALDTLREELAKTTGRLAGSRRNVALLEARLERQEAALREIATGTKAWTREQMIDLAVAALSTPPNQEDK